MNTNNIASFVVPTSANTRVNPETGRNEYVPGFREQDFRTDVLGTSDCNDFIPLIGLLNHNLITFPDKPEIKVLEYTAPLVPSVGCSYFRQYDRFITNFKNTNAPVYLAYTLQGVTHRIYVHRGIMYDTQGNILMCLGVNKEYALNTPYEQLAVDLDPSKIVVFISNLFDNPIYKNVRKKIDTLYLEGLRAAGVDVVHTSRLNDWLFKNNYKSPQFKNVRESISHLRKEVPKYLLID